MPAKQLKGVHKRYGNLFIIKCFKICQNNFFSTQGMPLSQNSRIAATVRYKRRTIVVDMEDLRVAHSDFTHIAISVLPTDEPVSLSK